MADEMNVSLWTFFVDRTHNSITGVNKDVGYTFFGPKHCILYGLTMFLL